MKRKNLVHLAAEHYAKDTLNQLNASDESKRLYYILLVKVFKDAVDWADKHPNI